MSSNHSIYYGIYLVCEGKREVEVDGNQVCPNGHLITYTGKFCMGCGAELITRKNKELLSFSDIVEEENDKFVVDNYCSLKERKQLDNAFCTVYFDTEGDLLIPNNQKVFGVFFSDDEGLSDSPPPNKKVMSIPEVRKLIADDIKLLRKVLYKKVTIKFGSISTWD